MKQLVLELLLMWDAGVAGGGLTHYAVLDPAAILHSPQDRLYLLLDYGMEI